MKLSKELEKKNTTKLKGEEIRIRDGHPKNYVRKGPRGGEYIYDVKTEKKIYLSTINNSRQKNLCSGNCGKYVLGFECAILRGKKKGKDLLRIVLEIVGKKSNVMNVETAC